MSPLAERLSPEQLERIQQLLGFAGHAALFQAEAMVALAGVALLALMAAPGRHQRAAAGLGGRGGGSFAVGFLAMLLPLILLAVLYHTGIPAGRFLLWTLLTIAVGLGISVAGRRLGERVLEDRGALAQTAIGVAALVMPLASLLLVPIVLAIAAAGLGAWLRAGRDG